MKSAGFNVFTLNLNNEAGDIMELLRNDIEKYNIDVVLTGGLIFEYHHIKKVLISSKLVKDNITTIVGGGMITASPIPAMAALEFCDFGVIGEGEITICELCRVIEDEGDIRGVKGIIYPPPPPSSMHCGNAKAGSYIQNITREAVADLDALPFPDYDGFGIGRAIVKTASTFDMNEQGVIPIVTSRSCPCLCTFCFHTNGNKYRCRSIGNVFDEIDILYKKYHPSYFYIVDESFGTNKARVKEFCRRIKPYGIKWRASYRVTDITEEIANILKDGNCDSVALGMESADNRILKSMKKGITIEQTEYAIKLCEDAGLNIQGNFIFGDIAETLETAKNTIQWWKKHEKFGFGLNFITTYPGTYLFKYAIENEIVADEIKFIKDGCPMINVSKMTIDEMKWLAEQINTLPLRNLASVQTVSNIKVNYNDGLISFDYNCDSCKQKNHIESIRLFVPRNSIVCGYCGNRHRIPLFENLKSNMEMSINRLMENNKRIAFWAITDTLSFYLQQISNLNNPNIFLIDGSILKQGSNLAGKIISSPDILNKENIDAVIIPPTLYFPLIVEKIQNEYKTVTEIISLIELSKPYFEVKNYV
jgi:radical SAM superfamily enzyme YgiQ (UPF0313 family)